jgi:hypothetical protein
MNGKSIIKYVMTTTAAIALLCATSGRVFALGTIIASAVDSNYLAVAGGGAWLAVGSTVEMGQFSISDAAISALQSGNTITPANEATLLAAFEPLTGGTPSGTVGTSAAFSSPGAFDITFTGNNTAFASGPIYLLAFNAGQTQIGVFKDGTFPSSMATGAESLELDNAAVPPLLGTYTAANPLDNVANDGNNGNAVINSFNLDQVIPEPSSIMLVAMGLFAGIGMIRRRQS